MASLKSKTSRKDVITKQIFIGLTIKSWLTVTRGFCSAMSRKYISLKIFNTVSWSLSSSDLRSISETVVLYLLSFSTRNGDLTLNNIYRVLWVVLLQNWSCRQVQDLNPNGLLYLEEWVLECCLDFELMNFQQLRGNGRLGSSVMCAAWWSPGLLFVHCRVIF